MATKMQPPNEVNPPGQPPVSPEVIPDVEIGIGAGDRNKNFSSVDPSKHERLPGQTEPPDKKEHLPGKDETLH